MIAATALPLVVLPKWLQVVACILVWLGASAGWGYLGPRLPTSRFDHDTWWSRLRGPERGGRLYERLGIKRWKDRLPEAGALYSGGFSKRDLTSHDRAHLERFVAETRRAEAVHWMADREVKIFGVETISPDLVYMTGAYTNHRACADVGITHYENLNNLKEVVNMRFQFYGFPLRLQPATGSPIRAVGIVED